MAERPAEKIGEVKNETGNDRTVCWDKKTGKVWVEYHTKWSWEWRLCSRKAEKSIVALEIAEAELRK